MIALNETNEYAAEVAFTLPLSSDPLTGLTGWSFTLGEVQIKLPGGSWINVAVNKIVEKGFGRFCARLTAAQTTVPGDVYIKASVTGAQTYYGSDVIGELGGDIPQKGSGSLNFFLPDSIDPINNPGLTGHTFAVGEVKICLPDASYVDADPSDIEEIGFGLYRLNLDNTQTTKRGKVFVYAEVSGYQRFEGYATILGTGSSGPDEEGEIIALPISPVNTTIPSTYMDLLTHAVNRLCEYSKSGEFEAGIFEDNVG